MEQVLYADLAPKVEDAGEQVLDVGPARLDELSSQPIAIEPGILLMSDRCLYFRGPQSVLRMNWLRVSEIRIKMRLIPGAKMIVEMENGNWSRFYLGKVYSRQIGHFHRAARSS